VNSKVSRHISDSFYSVLTVSGEFQYGCVAGPEVGKTVVLKYERVKSIDALCKFIGYSGIKPG